VNSCGTPPDRNRLKAVTRFARNLPLEKSN
jgi:hypothetical protein